jgi:hypothetical protein
MASKEANQMQYRHMIERMFGINQVTSDQVRGQAMWGAKAEPPGWKKLLFGDAAYEGFSFADQMKIDAGVTGSKRTPYSLSSPIEDAIAEIKAAKPGAPSVDADGSQAILGQIVANAEAAGRDVQSALSVNAKPSVDASSIDIAIGKAKNLLSILQQAGSAVSSVGASADAEMRRNMSDYGVSP